MTPRTIIASARHALNDTDPTGYRQEDAELLRYVNLGLCEFATLAPQLFATTGDLQCIPGATEQGVTFADAQAFAEVVRVRGGGAVLLADMGVLSAFMPNWGQSPAGPAQNWFKHPGDPLRFYLYPAAPEGQVIEVKYIRNPATVVIDDEITDLAPANEPALVDYVIARAEFKDDEFAVSGRASAAYQQFLAKLRPA